MPKNHYETLGVSRDAKSEDISKAFKKLALATHPDKNNGSSESEAAFKSVNRAFSILSDSKLRMEYDKELRVKSNLSSAVDDVIGRKRNRQDDDILDIEEPETINYSRSCKVQIAYNESLTGVQRPVQFESNDKERCKKCDGTGSSTKQRMKCYSCEGGFHFTFATGGLKKLPCKKCDGSGSTPLNRCHDCHGVGKISRVKTIIVNIPPGVSNGDELRLELGDVTLYIEVSVSRQEVGSWRKNDRDLETDLFIELNDAMLGSIHEIEKIDGSSLVVEIKPGLKDGSKLYFRGAGIKFSNSKPGDVVVNVRVRIPELRTPRAAKLAQELFDEIYRVNR
jgi:molecular chaperone DnaJ